MTEDLSTVRSYRSGGWFGIFGQHASVLLPPSEKARVAALWELVDGGSDFGEVLDALIASGLRGLPGFVLTSSGDEPTRVVLRGAARAHFTVAGADDVHVDGGEAATWVEKILHGVTSARIELEDGGGADDYVLETGLVRVSRVDEPPYRRTEDEVAGDAEPVDVESAAFGAAPVAPAAVEPAPVESAPVESAPVEPAPVAPVGDDEHDRPADVAAAAAPGAFAAPVVVPLGEITDEESVRESPAPAVEDEPDLAEEPDAGQDDEPFAAYAEGEASEEPADAEPVAPADEPTEQFDPMQHEAGDYDPAPVEPVAAYAEGQASEEPAAEPPAAEEYAATGSTGAGS